MGGSKETRWESSGGAREGDGGPGVRAARWRGGSAATAALPLPRAPRPSLGPRPPLSSPFTAPPPRPSPSICASLGLSTRDLLCVSVLPFCPASLISSSKISCPLSHGALVPLSLSLCPFGGLSVSPGSLSPGSVPVCRVSVPLGLPLRLLVFRSRD